MEDPLGIFATDVLTEDGTPSPALSAEEEASTVPFAKLEWLSFGCCEGPCLGIPQYWEEVYAEIVKQWEGWLGRWTLGFLSRGGFERRCTVLLQQLQGTQHMMPQSVMASLQFHFVSSLGNITVHFEHFQGCCLKRNNGDTSK